MKLNLPRHDHLFAWLLPLERSAGLLFLASLVFSTGCAGLKLPQLDTLVASSVGGFPALSSDPNARYIGPDGGPPSANLQSEQVYYATRQAKTRGGIALHLPDDENPVRVLPLPDDGRSVYVSQLLKQAGVMEQLGRVEVTLFRESAHTIGGLPLECKVSEDGDSLRPETDYSLRPGDRIRVRKASSKNLVDMFLLR